MPRRIALVVLTLLAGCGLASDDTPAQPPGVATVVRHVDGDTLVVDIDGSEEPVRLIGIDTPETVAQDRPVECFGPEASARMAELLPVGTPVRLERDVEARDRYDRLLAYVVRADDGAVINVVMVEEGFAESVRYPPNLARQAELDRAEADARSAQRGLWPACGGTDVAVDG
ncbi:MAG: thermonuclease family protein [Acidimicrobiales bacterium]